MSRTSRSTTAAAIVERLTGNAPASADVAKCGRRRAQALRIATMLHRRILGRRRLRRLPRRAVYVGAHKMILDALDQRTAKHQGGARRGAPPEGRGAGAARRIRAQAGRSRARGRRHHRRRQGRGRAARRRGQGQVRGIPRPPHQAGRDQDRPGRSAGGRRRAQCRRRGRGRCRRDGADRHGQGQGRRRPDRQGHRGSQSEAQLNLETAISGTPAGPSARASSAASAEPAPSRAFFLACGCCRSPASSKPT